jgi:hypothetical protein
MSFPGLSSNRPETSLPGVDRIASTIAVISGLYFARDVLVPITLAIILSLLIAHFVRWLRHLGFGHTSSVLTAVGILMPFRKNAGDLGTKQLYNIQGDSVF